MKALDIAAENLPCSPTKLLQKKKVAVQYCIIMIFHLLIMMILISWFVVILSEAMNLSQYILTAKMLTDKRKSFAASIQKSKLCFGNLCPLLPVVYKFRDQLIIYA